MTRKDLACVHEPFGDAFYYGPERIGRRYEDDEEARIASGFANSTYQTIIDRITYEGSEGKRVFIKDIIHYLLPPNGKPAQIAPSLVKRKRGIGTEINGTDGTSNGASDSASNGSSRPTSSSSNGSGDSPSRPFPYGTFAEPGNPTVIPGRILKQFQFTFLIRDPHYSIPSYYRCTIPPLDKVTGFYQFYPEEAGYDEVRRVFDYLVASGMVGPYIAGQEDETTENGVNGTGSQEKSQLCVVDADDLLDSPAAMIEEYCKNVDMTYDPDMLHWEDEDNQRRAREAFEKWRGFHDDAIDSTELRPRAHKKMKTEDEFDAEWTQKYGLKGANIIRQTVDANMPTYLYLKQFAIKV